MRWRKIVLGVLVVAMFTVAGTRMPHNVPAGVPRPVLIPQPTPPVGPLSWEVTLWSGGVEVGIWYTDERPVYEDGLWSFVDVVFGQPVEITGTVSVTY
ncbi:MAG: hypothetical protein ACYTEQ_30240 [Planctomycetota bacterium]|jgi:hypothetical protein